MPLPAGRTGGTLDAGGGKQLVGDRVQVAKAYFGTLQMDRLDREQALVIVENKGGLSLRVLPLP